MAKNAPISPRVGSVMFLRHDYKETDHTEGLHIKGDKARVVNVVHCENTPSGPLYFGVFRVVCTDALGERFEGLAYRPFDAADLCATREEILHAGVKEILHA